MKLPLANVLRRADFCRLFTTLLATAFLAGVPGCKPPAPPTGKQEPSSSPVAAPSPAAAQRRPGADDLAGFLRAGMPSFLKLAELKYDPPVPLPGAAPGSNAWLYNVRVTFAPAEDVLAEPEPQAAQGFASAVDELNALAAWSQAYARSPYAARDPGFAVEPPNPARPRFLKLMHAKDKPYAPLYGKLSAEWQVDHWQYALVSLQTPTDIEDGQPRSGYGQDPILVEGSLEAARFMGRVKASLEAAKPKKAALDAAYHADLLAATRPGTTYKGELVHGKNHLPAEVRFLPAAPGDEPKSVRLEFRLFHPDYVYLCAVQLADSPPVPAADLAGAPVDESAAFQGDLAAGYLHVTDPKFDPISSPSADFRSATMSAGLESHFWLRVQDHRLSGNMTLYPFQPPYYFDGQQAP